MTVVTLGIDLGKNNCSVAGLDAEGRIVLRRPTPTGSIVKFTAKLSPRTIAMEACCGAHYLGRLLLVQGHRVRLMPPEYVRPYVKAHKNDDRDAEDLARADVATRRLSTIPGIGALNATALVRCRRSHRFYPSATSAPGWDSFHGNIQPAASQDRSESASVGTYIYALCRSMARGRFCPLWPRVKHTLAHRCVTYWRGATAIP